MNRNKKIFSFAILAASVATTLGVISTLNTNSFATVKAEDCTHSGAVEHYDATATTIEHWACCTCHQAWADEARTILVSKDTFTQRTKLETELCYNISHHGDDYPDWEWDGATYVKYDAEYGFTYARDLTNTVEAFFQLNDTVTTIGQDETYEVELTNNTDSTLRFSSTSRTWDATSGTYSIVLNPGEKSLLSISAHCWNNVEKPDKNKGFAIRVANNNGGKYTGTITVSKPMLKTFDLASHLEITNNGAVSVTNSNTYGRVFTFQAAANIYLKGLKAIDLTKYTAAELYIYHESGADVRFTVWSEDWNGHGPNAIDAKSGVWSQLIIPADTWNGDRNSCAIGFYDTNGLSGTVKIAVKGFIEKPMEQYYNVSHHGTYDWIWDDKAITLGKNESNGFETHTMTFNGTTEAFFQTLDTSSTVANDAIFEVEVTNNTNAQVRFSSTSRTWDATSGTYAVDLNPGESAMLKISAHCWNNVDKPDKNKGFAIRITPLNAANFSGEITLSEPSAYEAGIVSYVDSNGKRANETVSSTYGRIYTVNFGGNLFMRDVLAVDTSIYSGVELYIYHESGADVRFTAWSEDWNDHGPDAIDAASGTWSKLIIRADTWNGDRNSCDIGFYDTTGLTGTVKIAVKGFVA